MTRNREIRCEDLFGCDHKAETPVAEDGEILYWLCRCGRRVMPDVPAIDAPKVGHSINCGEPDYNGDCQVCSPAAPKEP